MVLGISADSYRRYHLLWLGFGSKNPNRFRACLGEISVDQKSVPSKSMFAGNFWDSNLNRSPIPWAPRSDRNTIDKTYGCWDFVVKNHTSEEAMVGGNFQSYPAGSMGFLGGTKVRPRKPWWEFLGIKFVHMEDMLGGNFGNERVLTGRSMGLGN